MRKISNDNDNSILFSLNGQVVSDSVTAEFKQFGGDNILNTAVNINSVDCFTVSYGVKLGENILKNGLYRLRILDSTGKVLFTATVSVDGNDSSSNYFVIDDGSVIDYVYSLPSFSSGTISFSSNEISFSDNKNQ